MLDAVPAPLSSLVPQETAVETVRSFAYSPAPAARLRLFRLLRDAGTPLRVAAGVRDCGRDIIALRHKTEPQTYLIVRATCKHRFCPTCAARRSQTLSKNLQTATKAAEIRMITLTLRHVTDPLADQLTHLLASFRRLRQQGLWKQKVQGGAYFVEITRNPATQTWHPHLHVLVSGTYYDHSDLRTGWLRASGSSIVHITLVRARAAISKYVAKYLTKPVDTRTYADDRAFAEAITAFKGRRTVGAFGSWTKLKLLAKPQATDFEMVGWIAELQQKAAEGDKVAQLLVYQARRMPEDQIAMKLQTPLVHATPAPIQMEAQPFPHEHTPHIRPPWPAESWEDMGPR